MIIFHLQPFKRNSVPSGLITIVNIEFGNRQLLQRGDFLAAFVSGSTLPAGIQMFAPGLSEAGTRMSKTDAGSFKMMTYNKTNQSNNETMSEMFYMFNGNDLCLSFLKVSSI